MLRLLLFLALLLPVSAQETMIREVFDPVTDTHVEVLALFTKPSPGGYFPVRVKVANNLKIERTVYLDFKSSSNYNDDLEAKSSFTFVAGAGKTITSDIMVPVSPTSDYSSDVVVTAKLTGSLGMASNSIRSSKENNQPAALLSESLFTPNASTLDSEIATKLSGTRGGSIEFAAKFDPKQLPDDWLAFSGYDSVIMTDADWSNVPPGARNAILSWVRLGGQLMVYSNEGASSSSLGLPDEAGFGTILRPSLFSGPAFAADMVKAVLDNKTSPQHVSQHNDYASSSWPLRLAFGAQTSHYTFFVLIMICFGILVGPINLFVFAKSGQRHRLFVTTPIISLAASLILIGLIIVLDGFGGNGLRRVLMEVRPDNGVNAAYVHQEQFSRTGVLTGAEFTIDTPVFFQPVEIEATRLARFTRGSGAKGSFNLQPADGKLIASGDWFQSRSEHGHALSAVVSTRGRIETTDKPDTFLSTFEFPIDVIYYLDKSGQWSRAEKIESGKRFTLIPVDPTMALPAMVDEAKNFSARNAYLLTAARKRPGHFVAMTKNAPGIDTNPGIHWKETRTVITGPVVAP